MVIRAETIADHGAIARVNRAAFSGDADAQLVERLRADGLAIASLVAVDDEGEIVGHIFFSPVVIETDTSELRVASLAPMAVVPTMQRRGIGSSLVRDGLEACRRSGYASVIVVGHPRFYPRFGFSHAVVAQLHNPFAEGDAFMGLEFAPGSLANLSDGRVVYPAAFNQL